MFNQRDIVLLPFPYSDLTGAKLRPALIISNKKLNISEDRICCLITSNEPKNDCILIDSIEEGKLPFKSWIKPHRLFTINEKIIKRKICTITESFHKSIISNINDYIK